MPAGVCFVLYFIMEEFEDKKGSNFTGRITTDNSKVNSTLIKQNEELLKQRDDLIIAGQFFLDNVDRWLKTDVPATPEQSKLIYEKMKKAIDDAKQK